MRTASNGGRMKVVHWWPVAWSGMVNNWGGFGHGESKEIID